MRNAQDEDIVVIGYSKSGNTWICRLVAELVGCSAVGFRRSGHSEIAREGLNRKSRFRCWKAHHTLTELHIDEISPQARLVYVLRDPRDSSVSGAYYFPLLRLPVLAGIFPGIPKGEAFYYRVFNRMVMPPRYRKERIVRAVLYGAPGAGCASVG